MDAGAYLSKGKYGCVFQPPIPCKPRSQKLIWKSKGKTVGKLTSSAEAQQSFDASLILASAKNVGDYIILIDSICKPVEGPEKDQCEPVKDIKEENVAQLIMPYGGITLEDLRTSKQQLIIKNFMPYMEHILEAGVFLLMKNLVHFDLHRYNVVVQDKPRLIDLGFVWSPTGLTKQNVGSQYRSYNPKINQESPEASFMNGRLPPFQIKKNILISDIIQRKSAFRIVQSILGLSLEAQEELFEKFLNSSKAIQEEDFYTIYKTYWSKFDAWGFGTIIAFVLYDCMFDTYFANSIYKPNKSRIDQVVRGLLHPDPGFRLDAVEALQIWNPKSAVLNEPSVASWIVQQSAYRTALSAASAASKTV